MKYLRRGTRSHGKTKVKTIHRLDIYIRRWAVYSGRSVALMWRTHLQLRDLMLAYIFLYLLHILYSHKYSFKLCSCILFNYIFFKFPCGTHIKSNWKLIPKYADCNIQKRMCNCCLSVKHTELLTTKGTRQNYHSHYRCIICAALARI
jgi:hypothetical protein